MPNKRKANKRQLNLSPTLELYRRIDKKRELFGVDKVSAAALILLEIACKDVELTAEDYERIAAEERQNEENR